MSVKVAAHLWYLGTYTKVRFYNMVPTTKRHVLKLTKLISKFENLIGRKKAYYKYYDKNA